jgi:hypothetical protein
MIYYDTEALSDTVLLSHARKYVRKFGPQWAMEDSREAVKHFKREHCSLYYENPEWETGGDKRTA